MLVTSGILVGINLLFSFSIPNISIATHLGGLVTGFLVAALVGFPARLCDAWAMSDRLSPAAYVTYDVNADRFNYHGPAGFALEIGLVRPNAVATTTEVGWSPRVHAGDLDPKTSIDAYIENAYDILALGGPAA
jgi:hypothetical protein